MVDGLKDRLYRLLRWSERYTHVDMVYFASGSFWQAFGQISSTVLSFALIVLFANLLPKETYGLYRYVLSLAAILNVFTLTGMSQSVMQAVATGQEGVLGPSVYYQLKWNALLMLAFWAAGAYYFVHQNWELTASLFILSFFLPFTAALNTYGAYLVGKREFRVDNLFSALATFLYVLGMAVAVLLTHGLIWLVLMYAASTFISTLIFYVVSVRLYRPPQAHDAMVAPVLAFGRKLTWVNLLGPLVTQLDSVILNHFWGPAPLAVYSIAMTIPNRGVPFLKDWVDVGFPKLATKSTSELNATFYKRLVQGMLLGAVIALAYIVAAPFIFAVLMPNYMDAVGYSQLLALTFVFAIPTRYLGLLFSVQRSSRLMFISNTIQAAVRLLLYIVLGVWGGILGLVLAQLACSILGMVINASVWLFSMRYARTST